MVRKREALPDQAKGLPGSAHVPRQTALHCHPLKGDRAGEWSIRLTGFWRLIFTLHGESLQVARIEEASKHYDD